MQHNGGLSPVAIIIVLAVIAYFFLMESSNIASTLGTAVSNYSSAAGTSGPSSPSAAASTTAVQTITLPLSDVLQAAGKLANATTAAATSNDTTAQKATG
jgi:hypothetical protein